MSFPILQQRLRALPLAAALLLSGCATGPGAVPQDPIEPFNRVVFSANDKLDRYVAVPLAKSYKAVLPGPVRTAIGNFFANLGDVGNTINNLLQGKGQHAVESLMRLSVNTVFGIGGLIDVATPAGLQKHSQDFGLTLGNWGLSSGPYLVLPLFGPSSIRDSVGVVGDLYADPERYVEAPTRTGLYALNFVSTRARLLDASELLEQAALDPYTFVRDAYLQQRSYRIHEGKETKSLPDYGDEGEMPAAPPAPAPEPVPAPVPDPVPDPVEQPPKQGDNSQADDAALAGTAVEESGTELAAQPTDDLPPTAWAH